MNWFPSLSIYLVARHHWFLEHWNSQKILCNIRQRFSCLLDEWIEKICKKKKFTVSFFNSTLSVLRCTWTGQINLKIFLGYHINYLSIWPFMCHPWFPTRKASKLTFVCFQLHLFSPCIVFNTCIFFQSTHQVGMKNIVKCYKHFFGYFNALETNGESFKREVGSNRWWY